MPNKKDDLDHGNQRRFKAKQGAFAALAPGYKQLGQIQEINRQGLCFHYIANGEPANGWVQVEIYSSVYDFYLKKIPAKVIKDFEIDTPNALSSIRVRQVDLQFGVLKSHQALLLDCFLKHYTFK
jgi:hypothetical protein